MLTLPEPLPHRYTVISALLNRGIVRERPILDNVVRPLMQKFAIVTVAVVIFLNARLAFAATILFSPMDSLDGWTIRSHGTTNAAIVAKGDSGQCVQVSSQNSTVFLTRDLRLDDVRGASLEIGCLVRTMGLVPGIQVTSTAKIHLAIQTPEGVRQHSVQFTDSDSWQFQGFTADVPDSAERVVLNLGLEACSGTVQFDQLVARNDRPATVPLDLSAAANAGHEQLGITAFPEGEVIWNDIPFKILDAVGNEGADCIRLKGVDHEDWPERITPPIPVSRAASKVYVLHATLVEQETAETPCAMWCAWFSGGHNVSLSVFEGREIGAIGATEDLENWHIAWRGKGDSNTNIVFGVTEWPIYMSAPVVNLTARSYRGSSPVILAITVVEEPPKPRPMMDDSEDGEEIDF